jgi:hypothetical protein
MLPDDGIVVVRSGAGRTRGGRNRVMFAVARSGQLKSRLGSEGLIELDAALDEAGQQWKEDVLEIAADRFERRLAVELSQFRVEVSKDLAAVRVEISASRLSTIRWVAGLLIALAGVMIGSTFAMMTFLVNALKAN